jgi:hypothetical protein
MVAVVQHQDGVVVDAVGLQEKEKESTINRNKVEVMVAKIHVIYGVLVITPLMELEVVEVVVSDQAETPL